MPVIELSSERGKKCVADGIYGSLHSDGPGGPDAAPLRAAFRRVRRARPLHLPEDTQNYPDDLNTIAPMTIQMFVQGDCDGGFPPDRASELWADALATARVYWKDAQLPLPFPTDKFQQPDMDCEGMRIAELSNIVRGLWRDAQQP